MEEPNCGNCRYFHSIPKQRGMAPRGECHIRSVQGGWPIREEDDWCGEHPNFTAWVYAIKLNSEIPAGSAKGTETRGQTTLDAAPHVIKHPPGTGKFEAEITSAVGELNEPGPSDPPEAT